MSEPFVGEIKMFAGNFAPRQYAFCDGQLLAISQNDALFSLLGTIYGGDGRTTFGLPDLRGRIPIHQGQGPGLSNRQIGQKTGVEQVTLNVNQLPAHHHDQQQGTDADAVTRDPAGGRAAKAQDITYGPFTSPVDMGSNSLSNTGGGQTHANIQPFQCINFIIALSGIYPSRN
ncbi:phage tail protein [Chloroflexota bacterium]